MFDFACEFLSIPPFFTPGGVATFSLSLFRQLIFSVLSFIVALALLLHYFQLVFFSSIIPIIADSWKGQGTFHLPAPLALREEKLSRETSAVLRGPRFFEILALEWSSFVYIKHIYLFYRPSNRSFLLLIDFHRFFAQNWKKRKTNALQELLTIYIPYVKCIEQYSYT